MKIDQEQLLTTALSVLMILIGALILWLLLARAANRARAHFERILDEADDHDAHHQMATVQRQLTALRMVVNAANYFLCAIVIVMLLKQIRVDLGSLILPASFVGAALGLGSQNLVRDMVAGFFIVFENQFSVGDVVSINGTLGTVEEVGFRVTRLRDDASQIHFFPNGTINAVAKYPRRAVPMMLLGVLEDAEQSEKAQALVMKTVESFDARFGAFAAPAEVFKTPVLEENEGQDVNVEAESQIPTPLVPSANFRLRLLVVPWRLQLVRDKLPANVTAALQTAEIKLEAGTNVEVITSYEV